MELSLNQKIHTFENVEIRFVGQKCTNIFAKKNNKTLSETVQHEKYAKLREHVDANYAEFLDEPLGTFLLQLKQQKDNYYLNFLNTYGDLTYQQFTIANPTYFPKKGLYAYSTNTNCDLKYIGRCQTNLKERINQGYGRINPKNCYKDGQSTNCRINHLIAKSDDVTFWFYEMDDNAEIEKTEVLLIQKYLPVWNKKGTK